MIPHSILALLLTAAPVVGDDDLATKLDDVLFRLAGSSGAYTWDLAQELRDVTRDDSMDAVPLLVERAPSLSGDVQLIVARTLMDVDAVDEAASILLGALESGRASQVLTMLANKAFRRVPGVESRLLELLRGAAEPIQRIAAARTLYEASRGRSRTEARSFLLETLDSDDPEIRAQGALALAETRDFRSSRPVLQALASDPGPRGQLARAYLKIGDTIDYYDERLYRQSQQVPRTRRLADSEAPKGSGTLDVIEELIRKVQDHHLTGENLRGPEGRERLITAAAKGMLRVLDPHSTYFSSREYERWILDLRRNYAGIGAYVDTVDGIFTITRPIYSGPAYRAGFMTGDKVLKVDGWDTRNQTNEEIIRRLKGEPGTEVVVSLWREGWDDTHDFVIERAVIHIPTVSSAMLPGSIGYLEVAGFAENTSRELLLELDSMRADGMRGLVLDLRNNSGGYLDEAVKMGSLFLGSGDLIVYTEGREVQRRDHLALPIRELYGDPRFRSEYSELHFKDAYQGPIVVLVNERSASASEIVSGALKVTGRAKLVGQRTFGKGSVQQDMTMQSRPGDPILRDFAYNRIYDPGDKYEDVDENGKYTWPVHVKLTNARYYLPDGTSLHTERDLDGRILEQGGVEPDVAVEFHGLEPWENNELIRLYENLRDQFEQQQDDSHPTGQAQFHDPFKEYVNRNFEEHRELLEALALDDGRDPARYPGFEDFRTDLDTHLPDQTLRRLLRAAVRDRVADARGKPFPGGGMFGDWQEDTQLQAAIRTVAEEMQLDLDSIAGYRLLARGPSDSPEGR